MENQNFSARLGDVAISQETGILTAAVDDMEVRTGLLLNSSRSRVAHYVSCRAQQILFQPDDVADDQGNVALPDFENCIFDECSFEELPEDATIHFYGKNIFSNCSFRKTQKVVVHGSMEIYNSRDVMIQFAAAGDYNLILDGSTVYFDSAVASSANSYNVKLSMNGGYIELPRVMLSSWEVYLTGVKVVGNENICAKVCATGCNILADHFIGFTRLHNCTVHFSSTTNTKAQVWGQIAVGCEFRPGDFDSDSQKIQTVEFDSWLTSDCIVQGIYNGTAFTSMQKGADAQKVSNCFNGDVLFNA